jgi:outer membrane immunogenic protein
MHKLLGDQKMKKLALGLLLSFAVSGAAVAADMAPRYTKAPPPVVSPAVNWSGFYIGAMGGYASQDSGNEFFVGVNPRMKGGFGGGTVGYNWQTGQFVFGLEADAAFADISASATAFGITAQSRINALGTVRGRVGVAFDSVLLYATGGYAWADNEISVAIPPLVSVSDSQFHHGWTAGAGVEWMFAPKWSLKLEYLYRDFSSETYFAGVLPPAGVSSGSAGFHSGQVGVNFHF